MGRAVNLLVYAAAMPTWTVLYMLTCRTFPSSAPFEPAPWPLAIYGTFIAGKSLLAIISSFPLGHCASSRAPAQRSVRLPAVWYFEAPMADELSCVMAIRRLSMNTKCLPMRGFRRRA